MGLLRKLKEVGSSVAPIVAIVTILHLLVWPLPEAMLGSFYIGSLLVIFGLALFLLGSEMGLVPIGEKIGSAITARRNVAFLVFAGILIGFVITLAEPDVSVLASQVAQVDPSLDSLTLVLVIALGVGIFVMFGMLRTLLHLSLKWVLGIGYLGLFVLAFFAPGSLVPVAFDSGGATTGPMAVPFIMAIGMGLARIQKKQDESDNFGFIAMASIGPVLGVLLLGLFGNGEGPTAMAFALEIPISGNFPHLFLEQVRSVSLSMTPLIVICVLFQVTLVRMPPRQVLRMGIGIIYAFLGLVLFFMGAHGGFMPVGYALGNAMALRHRLLLPLLGFLFGAVTVLAEPAVWVLVGQVEQISKGRIRKPVLLGAMSIGVGISVCLAMMRITEAWPIWYILVPGYAIALLLLPATPHLFSAMAFDSGGVASGPMSSTFILSFAIGVSVSLGGNPALDAFGIIAFVAMMPIIVLQLLGLLYGRKQARMERRRKSHGG